MKQSARILRDMCLFWSRNVEVREVKMVHILDIFLTAGIGHILDVKV